MTTLKSCEDIILSEINQPERQILHDLTSGWNLKKSKAEEESNQTKRWPLPGAE